MMPLGFWFKAYYIKAASAMTRSSGFGITQACIQIRADSIGIWPWTSRFKNSLSLYVLTYNIDKIIPTTKSYCEIQEQHVQLCRLFTAQGSTAEETTGNYSPAHFPLAKSYPPSMTAVSYLKQ